MAEINGKEQFFGRTVILAPGGEPRMIHLATGDKTMLTVDGIFIFIGYVAKTKGFEVYPRLPKKTAKTITKESLSDYARKHSRFLSFFNTGFEIDRPFRKSVLSGT